MRSISFVVVLLLYSLPASAVSPITIPDTPAGHVLQAWLDAFNSGDRDRYASFLAGSFPSRLDALTVGADEPHVITSLNLAAIPRPAEFPIARLTEDEDAWQPH